MKQRTFFTISILIGALLLFLLLPYPLEGRWIMFGGWYLVVAQLLSLPDQYYPTGYYGTAWFDEDALLGALALFAIALGISASGHVLWRKLRKPSRAVRRASERQDEAEV